jgi:hypothetical protein
VNMPGADDEREDAGTALVDITNGGKTTYNQFILLRCNCVLQMCCALTIGSCIISDMGAGKLWSIGLSYEFTETFAPFCSAYLPEFDPRVTPAEFWAQLPTEMDVEYTMLAIAGERTEFRMKARDKNRDDRPYGADVFYIDLTQQCDSVEPGHVCRWNEEPVYEWVESIDLDPTFNDDLRMNYPEFVRMHKQCIAAIMYDLSSNRLLLLVFSGGGWGVHRLRFVHRVGRLHHGD